MESKLRFIQHGVRRTVSIVRYRPVASGIVALVMVGVCVADAGEALSSAVPAVARSAAASTVDAQDIFDARSPGSRRYGWLRPTKQPRAGFDVGPPSERVLTSVRRRPETPAGPVGVDGSAPAAYIPINGEFDASQQTPIDVAPFDDAVPAGPGGVLLPGTLIGGVLPGTGASGVGGSPGNGGTTATPAVPEPATWAMLVLGFFGIGAVTRRRKPGRQLCEER